MFNITLPYWKTIDWIIIIIAIVIFLCTVSCGKHYDCNNWSQYNTPILFDVIDYCQSDRMQDYTKDNLGRQKDWRMNYNHPR